MPFPCHAGVIPFLCQDLRNGWCIQVKVPAIFCHSNPVLVFARHEGGPGRTTTGTIIHLCETYTILCKHVNVWGFNLPSKTARIGKAKIVRHNDDDVGCRLVSGT